MITIVGLGFVGLTTALGFSHKNYMVYGFESDLEKRNTIKRGKIPFCEAHLEDILSQNLNKRFLVCDSLEEAITQSQTIFFCVGSQAREDGSVDLMHLLNAIEATVSYLKKGEFKTLVIKTSVPPSITKEIVKPFIKNLGYTVGLEIGLANNPEFLREGYAWNDFINPDRIIIGHEDDRTGEMVRNLYKPFKAPIHMVSLNTAEFIKYLSNTLLSTMISFSNETAMIANTIGEIDTAKAFKVLHEDKRWFGTPANIATYAYPGCGFGGYCLPKDLRAFETIATQKGYDPILLKSVSTVNHRIKEHVADRIAASLGPNERLGILGLSFKPHSDDVRETPVKDIIQLLLKRGYNNITAYDPIANETFQRRYQLPITYAASLEEILLHSKKVVILTACPEFREKKALLREKNALDFRGVLS